MLISIILPTYNGSKYIGEAIQSCLKQTYKNIELIIVNDCSTDNTATIISEFAETDDRVKIISNKTNRQLPASLNIGFNHALGGVYTWISDDNLFAPNALEIMYNALEEDDKYEIVYSSYYFIDESGEIIDEFNHIPEDLIFKCAPGACFLYKKDVHEQLNGFDEQKFRMEDMDFWLRAATKFNYKHIDVKELYYYRKHSNNLTSAIFSDQNLYTIYRNNHLQSFRYFFKHGLGCEMNDSELALHLELYFEDISINKGWDFSISEKVISYIEYLDKLLGLPWNLVGFNGSKVNTIIKDKKDKVVRVVINDLLLENKLLLNKNPELARHFNKPISWYYKEYEVLPAWYKKVGHIIKVLQGNRPLRTLLKNRNKG